MPPTPPSPARVSAIRHALPIPILVYDCPWAFATRHDLLRPEQTVGGVVVDLLLGRAGLRPSAGPGGDTAGDEPEQDQPDNRRSEIERPGRSFRRPGAPPRRRRLGSRVGPCHGQFPSLPFQPTRVGGVSEAPRHVVPPLRGAGGREEPHGYENREPRRARAPLSSHHGSAGTGNPSRMRRENAGSWSAAWARPLTFDMSRSSAKGRRVSRRPSL